MIGKYFMNNRLCQHIKHIKFLIIILIFLLYVQPVYAANTYSADFEEDSTQSLTDESNTNSGSGYTAYTVEAWINLESLLGVGEFMSITSEASEAGRMELYLFNDGGTQKLLAQVHTSTTGWSTASYTVTLSTGTWYHIAIVWSGNGGNLKIYVNATLQATSGQTDGTISTSTTRIVVGAFYDNTQFYFDGKIDEVRFWNDVRTQSEISDNKDTELTGVEAGLNHYYKLNNNFTDSAASLDLTNNNSVIFSNETPFNGAARRQYGVIFE